MNFLLRRSMHPRVSTGCSGFLVTRSIGNRKCESSGTFRLSLPGRSGVCGTGLKEKIGLAIALSNSHADFLEPGTAEML